MEEKTMYIKPETVISPKDKISSDIIVLYDGGEWEWSLGLFCYARDYCLGARWNGSQSPGSPERLGNPQSRGYATWFVIPAELAAHLIQDKGLDIIEKGLEKLSEKDRKLAEFYIADIIEQAKIQEKARHDAEAEG